MSSPVEGLGDDLLAERAQLDGVLAGLAAEQWDAATPAPGWTIRDQVVHLAWFDDAARLSIAEPDRFRAERVEALADIDGFVANVGAAHRDRPPGDLLSWLRRSGPALVAAARAGDPTLRVPWYGPDMTIASCLTARIMETWAHGRDIADAVGLEPEATERLRHVAFLGARAFANSFRARGLPVPQAEVRVELTAPDGGTWAFGADRSVATDTVSGPALDFCLLVTQRRHRADTSLIATGAAAHQWLDIAQAFAGPPGAGRPPRAHMSPSGPSGPSSPGGPT